jgi:hypothetical protein
MAYDDKPTKYSFGNFDFGGGADETFSIKGPKGKAGLLYDYGVQGIIEAMNGDTTDPTVAVGTTSDPDAYGDEFTMSNADNDMASIRNSYRPDEAGFSTYMVNRVIPKDTEVYLTCTAATGANLTGQGVPFVEIIWDR